MPLLSFVLVAGGGRDDVEACAGALLGPELADVELVAVVDGAPAARATRACA
jgi:hypothetical protein